MTEFAARISRVRMKSGGADVRVIEGLTPLHEDDWRGDILRNARQIVEWSNDVPLVGYVVVGLFANGKTSTGWRYDGQKCPVPMSILPAWVAEVIRRDIVTQSEAVDVFNRSMGFDE